MRIVAGRWTADADALVQALRDVGDRFGCLVQGIDARFVAGDDHLRTAVELARRAHERGVAIADDPAMETLLYAAGTRQIDRALEMGIRPETESIVVVVDGPEEETAGDAVADLIEPNGSIPGDPETIRDWFEITDAEMAATTAPLEALVCERGVLLQLDA